MSDLKAAYFRALGLSPQVDREELQAALQRAHEVRQFEIELYWKRSLYFWPMQAAIFAAYSLIFTKALEPGKAADTIAVDSTQIVAEPTARAAIGAGSALPATDLIYGLVAMLALLGLMTAWASLNAARGSKFWQKNWENHIDMLEDGLEGRLYKTVWLEEAGSKSYSVSGVNLSLSHCFAGFWVVGLLVPLVILANEYFDLSQPPFWLGLLAITAVGCVISPILVRFAPTRRTELPGVILPSGAEPRFTLRRAPHQADGAVEQGPVRKPKKTKVEGKTG